MKKLMFEAYKVMTLGMLIDTIEEHIKAIDPDSTIMLCTDEVYEMFTETSIDVTVDGNHLGTMVGLDWALEQLRDNPDAIWHIAYNHDLPRETWREALAKVQELHQAQFDPSAWCLQVTS